MRLRIPSYAYVVCYIDTYFKWGTNEDVHTVCMFACICMYIHCTVCLYKQTYTQCISMQAY